MPTLCLHGTLCFSNDLAVSAVRKYHTGAGPVLLVRTRWLRVVNTHPHDTQLIWGRAAVKTGHGSEACSLHDSTFICRTSVHPTFSKRV